MLVEMSTGVICKQRVEQTEDTAKKIEKKGAESWSDQ